jgi:hypothetical protein
LWLLVAAISPSHKTRFFFLKIIHYLLLVTSGQIAHLGVESNDLVWRLGRNVVGKWL